MAVLKPFKRFKFKRFKMIFSKHILRVMMVCTLLLVGLFLTACNTEDLAKSAGQVTREAQKKGEELKASLDKRIGEAAVEAEKRINEEKDKLIDKYLEGIGNKLKNAAELDISKEDNQSGDNNAE